jgi:hypothetical protein
MGRRDRARPHHFGTLTDSNSAGPHTLPTGNPFCFRDQDAHANGRDKLKRWP